VTERKSKFNHFIKWDWIIGVYGMNYYDDEEKILDAFRICSKKEVHFPIITKEAVEAFEVIYNSKKWNNWINSAGKECPTPDFYSDKYGLMMEVMRVDDHAHYTEKGVLINPVNQRESMLQKEIRQRLLEQNSDADLSTLDIYINVTSGLPTNEDHNYRFYVDNFVRTIEKHINNIPTYRKNHPDKKLIFFVFDESTAYLLVEEALAKRGPVALEEYRAEPLWHYVDERFLEVFMDSDIEYLVWYTPYKIFHGAQIQPPKVCVFDIKQYKFDNIVKYSEKHIISSEA